MEASPSFVTPSNKGSSSKRKRSVQLFQENGEGKILSVGKNKRVRQVGQRTSPIIKDSPVKASSSLTATLEDEALLQMLDRDGYVIIPDVLNHMQAAACASFARGTADASFKAIFNRVLSKDISSTDWPLARQESSAFGEG